jgi:hypothetical protein
MRYAASEKAQIIQLFEQSHLPAERTLQPQPVPTGRTLSLCWEWS